MYKFSDVRPDLPPPHQLETVTGVFMFHVLDVQSKQIPEAKTATIQSGTRKDLSGLWVNFLALQPTQ